MKKYKVVDVDAEKLLIKHDSKHYVWAIELRRNFGLDFFSVQEIMQIWEYHSERYCAGWLQPSKEGVEEAFGVTLEEI